MLRFDVNRTLKFSIYILFFGCSSTQNATVIPNYQSSEPKQYLAPGLTLKDLVENDKLAIDYESLKESEREKTEANYFIDALKKKNNYSQAIEQTCQSFADGAFCRAQKKSEYFPSQTSPRVRMSSSERQEMQKNISAGKFELVNQSPESIISVMSRLSKSATSNAIQSVLKSEACYATSLYYAVGYLAESLLPGVEALNSVLSLYRKAVNCGNDEASARAAYRLALFKMDEKKCQEAKPLFEKVLSQPGLKSLHSRSMYWAEKCDPNKSNAATLAEESYNASPLSFHGMLGLQDAGIELLERIKLNPEPLAVSRVGASVKINQTLRVAEYLISQNEKRGAKNILLSLSFDEMYGQSPELALYVSYLFHRIDEGLFKFQTLATVLSRNPALKTPTTMKLFYPNWHYDLVEKYAKAVNLDPYLVMALIRQESAFHTNAQSGARAMGLMQLLPSTARMVDRRVNKKQLFDPETNVRIGTQYLARGIKRFDGNVNVTLAAYNAGGGIVGTWLKRYPIEDSMVFSDLIPYRETREYVGSILRNYYWYKALYEQQNVPLNVPAAAKIKITPEDTTEIPTMIDVLPPTTIEEEPEDLERNIFVDEMIP